ncbi:MAG: stage III sporulation protein AB [Oscillospiraceae bacterium]|nr:stage III sporulation protein AB [Oscillospiraceae bacterium]MDD4413648.1 stage III sporulation protein AB [Oscillospiraceae bacterium]
MGTGIVSSLSLSRRTASLELLDRFIVYLETQIRYSASPIRQIIIQAANGEFARLSFITQAAIRLKNGGSPYEAWIGAAGECSDECSFTAADREIIIDFGKGLGNTDIEGQLSHCEAFRRLLRDRLQTARCESRTKGKLYITLGIAGGLAAALLMY